MIVGALHLDDCQVQPLLPIWHIVAGASGLCTPFFYLLFDDVSPWLTRRFPGISDFIDNAVVCFLPIYIVFEVAWLITGKIGSFLIPCLTVHSRRNRLYLFQVVLNHCGCTPRGVLGVK